MTTSGVFAGGGSRIGYGLTMFATAACTLIVEILAACMIAPYFGMTLHSWTAIIAAVLAGLSAGHWIGGRLSERPPGSAAKILAMACFGSALITALAPVLLPSVAGSVVDAGLDPIAGVILVSVLFFLPPSLFLGVVAPILTKLVVDEDPNNTGPIVGRMFALGAAGSIFGALSAGYVFLSWVGITATLMTVAGFLSVLAFLFVLPAGRGKI